MGSAASSISKDASEATAEQMKEFYTSLPADGKQKIEAALAACDTKKDDEPSKDEPKAEPKKDEQAEVTKDCLKGSTGIIDFLDEYLANDVSNLMGIKEWFQAFRRLSGGDAFIKKEKLRSSISSVSTTDEDFEKVIKPAFEMSEKGGNSSLNYEGFVHCLIPDMIKATGWQNKVTFDDDMILPSFCAACDGSTGLISKDAWVSYIVENGCERDGVSLASSWRAVAEEEFGQILELTDENGDKMLNYSEFKKLAKLTGQG